MAAEVGLAAPQSILQTGNLVFESSQMEPSAIERALEAAAEHVGLQSDVIVRSASDWTSLVAGNPFENEGRDDLGHLVLLVLKAEASPDAQVAIETAIKGRERVSVSRRAAYVHYPDGIGRSKLTMGVLERHLGTRATGRNWRTVGKIAAAVAPRAGLSA